jgi:DNA-binding Xre family transcriptional regulator
LHFTPIVPLGRKFFARSSPTRLLLWTSPSNISPSKESLCIISDDFHPAAIASLAQIDRMQVEVKEYNDLKLGQIEITMASIEDLPKVLTQKRIGLGMTQKELAAKLGIKEQMVQRYEASGYESIGFQRLVEVWNALSASMPTIIVTEGRAESPSIHGWG